jgi:UDPglucose 6-dehydrogenase
MEQKIGIIGNGFVGKAMKKLFPDALVFDRGADQKEINACFAVFVCVPTDLRKDGTLDMSIVEDVVAKCEAPLIIIRSTLQPGFSQFLTQKYGKNISVVPEYVGETPAHPLLDEKNRPFLVIGGDLKVRRQVINLFQQVYNSNIQIIQVNNYAAELIKLAENRAIAHKVMEIHELYEACKAAKVDFYTIRDVVYGADPRFNLWFTFVYPDNLGFQSSKCLSKDLPAWVAWAKQMGYEPEITKLLIKKSRQYEKQNQENGLKEITLKN